MITPSRKRARRPGDRVANAYTLGKMLGVGGMGVVYAAQRDELGPTVAIKLLHVDHTSDPRGARRLRDEARAAQCVSHPNVVAVLDVSAPGDSVPFVVMEHVQGTLLSSILRDVGTLPLRRATDIACQILAGLEAIHAAGVVHGDIKSANILVEERPEMERGGERWRAGPEMERGGERWRAGPKMERGGGRWRAGPDGSDNVKIIDFGLASIHRRGQPPPDLEYADDGTLLTAGTPDYMAPELIRGGEAIPSSDLYAVAVLVYQMITGTTPFCGGAQSAILSRHLDDSVVPPSQRSPDRWIPVDLEHAVMRGLEKQASARFPTAALFAAALAAAAPATLVERVSRAA